MTNKFEIRLGASLRGAWELFLKGPEVFISITFASMALFFLLAYLPVVGTLVALLLGALTPAALFLAAGEGARAENISFQSLRELLPVAPQLVTLFLVKALVVSIGCFFLILPGLYLATVLVFAELFVLLEGKNFWEAMIASKNLAHGNLLGTFGLCAFLSLLAVSGALLIGIGLLVTLPIAFLALYCEFRRIKVVVNVV